MRCTETDQRSRRRARTPQGVRPLSSPTARNVGTHHDGRVDTVPGRPIRHSLHGFRRSSPVCCRARDFSTRTRRCRDPARNAKVVNDPVCACPTIGWIGSGWSQLRALRCQQSPIEIGKARDDLIGEQGASLGQPEPVRSRFQQAHPGQACDRCAAQAIE